MMTWNFSTRNVQNVQPDARLGGNVEQAEQVGLELELEGEAEQEEQEQQQ